MAYSQEPEVDNIYIRSGGNVIFDGVSFNPDSVDSKIIDALDTLGIKQPIDSLSFSPNVVNVGFQQWTIKADTFNHTFTVFLGESEISPQLFLENYVIGYNRTGATITNGQPVYTDSCNVCHFGQFKLAIATDKNIAQSVVGVATHNIEAGTIGFAVKSGNMTFAHGHTIGSVVYVSDTSAGGRVDYEPINPNYNIRLGRALSDSMLQIDVKSFTRTDTEVNLNGFLNGIVTKTFEFNDTIIGSDIYIEFWNKNYPTENLPFMYDKDAYKLNTTDGSGYNGRYLIQVTPGTANASQTNYFYINNSGATPVIEINTTGYPDTGVPLGVGEFWDVATHVIRGYLFQRLNNSVDGSVARGWQYRSGDRMRDEGSIYKSGADITFTIVTNAAGNDTLRLSHTAGIGKQFNFNTITESDGRDILLMNHPTLGEVWINSASEITLDSEGNTLLGNNTRVGFDWFILLGSGNAPDILAVNTPSGSYSSDLDAINDIENYSNSNVPLKYKQTAISLCRTITNYSTSSSGTYTNLLGAGNVQDKRGFTLGSTVSGAGSGSGISFPLSDNTFSLFNNAEPTKLMNISVSNVTTGTTSTQQWPTASGSLAQTKDTAIFLSRFDGDTLQRNIDNISGGGDQDSSWQSVVVDTFYIRNTTDGHITDNGQGSIIIHRGNDEITVGGDEGDAIIINTPTGVEINANDDVIINTDTIDFNGDRIGAWSDIGGGGAMTAEAINDSIATLDTVSISTTKTNRIEGKDNDTTYVVANVEFENGIQAKIDTIPFAVSMSPTFVGKPITRVMNMTNDATLTVPSNFPRGVTVDIWVYQDVNGNRGLTISGATNWGTGEQDLAASTGESLYQFFWSPTGVKYWITSNQN